MDCKTAQVLIPLYFDGELDRATSREFEAHLDECGDCRAALIELDALRRTLREDAPRYSAPDTLRMRIQKHAPPSATLAPIRRTRARWLALAASWVLAFVAGGAVMTTWHLAPDASFAESQVTRDLFASHWRALAATSPIDVVSTDQHTVKPWFAGKIAIAPVVQDFADEGYALIGGRIDYVGSERVPVLVYRHGKHLIDVFVLTRSTAPSLAKPTQSQGYVLEMVSLGGQPAAIVSDMGLAELDRFGDLLGTSK